MNSAHFAPPSFGSAARGPALGLEFPAHIFGLERAGQALCGDADGLFDECAPRLWPDMPRVGHCPCRTACASARQLSTAEPCYQQNALTIDCCKHVCVRTRRQAYSII